MQYCLTIIDRFSRWPMAIPSARHAGEHGRASNAPMDKRARRADFHNVRPGGSIRVHSVHRARQDDRHFASQDHFVSSNEQRDDRKIPSHPESRPEVLNTALDRGPTIRHARTSDELQRGPQSFASRDAVRDDS
ncbi:unnamed protein product [Trichogramma brassicae]|uniref:Uncharacterized protein n=1 Tax=Trichogramma brassicae TaxID=86971 RepID=A0A6H5J6R8_9HYME|nr:unnamed protein product [Trichogramma brassicae]